MSEPAEDLKAPVEGGDGIFVIRSGKTCRSWNGIRYKTGLSGKNVGAKKLSMNVATIPPGGVAYAHIHVDFEVMLYILQGQVRHEYGPGLTKSVDNQAGDFIYIEPGVPHEVFNLSNTEPVVAVVAKPEPAEGVDSEVDRRHRRRVRLHRERSFELFDDFLDGVLRGTHSMPVGVRRAVLRR